MSEIYWKKDKIFIETLITEKLTIYPSYLEINKYEADFTKSFIFDHYSIYYKLDTSIEYKMTRYFAMHEGTIIYDFYNVTIN